MHKPVCGCGCILTGWIFWQVWVTVLEHLFRAQGGREREWEKLYFSLPSCALLMHILPSPLSVHMQSHTHIYTKKAGFCFPPLLFFSFSFLCSYFFIPLSICRGAGPGSVRQNDKKKKLVSFKPSQQNDHCQPHTDTHTVAQIDVKYYRNKESLALYTLTESH